MISDKEIMEMFNKPEPPKATDSVIQMLDWAMGTREWVPRAVARIEAVRELHKEIKEEDIGVLWRYCAECGNVWPCPTLEFLDEN